MSRAYLSLGSNLDPLRHLRQAVDELRARFGAIELSPVYRTRAVGFDGNDFLNAAAFVLRPLVDIAPAVVVPGDGRTLAALWAVHPDGDTALETVSLVPTDPV